MTLKRAKIRGVESSSMVCSEKELGISEEHEGVIVLDPDAPPGVPLVEYMGDVVLEIAITPNIARNASVLGIARELSALTGAPLRQPSYEVPWSGPPLSGRLKIEIRVPDDNPRFVAGLIEGVEIGPSSYEVQRRLRLAGMRPINNIVDATNYAMLELGQPLHAFDYDVLVERAEGKAPTIITRLPESNERLTTLDDVERRLDPFTVLVADSAGALSLAGVMGGLESEVSEGTTRVLLEGAAWDYVHIRRTVASQKLPSEAAYRFERGVHPAQAERGVRLGLIWMQRLAGGEIAEGLVDEYPRPPEPFEVEIDSQDVRRLIGIDLSAEQMAEILERLQFEVRRQEDGLRVAPPDHRLDISSGVIGKADLMEEIARIYGYDRIPETQISDTIPPQYGNPVHELEERLRDLLTRLELQEVLTYRMTTPEKESRLMVEVDDPEPQAYIQLANPITPERTVMRRTLLAGLLEVIEYNIRWRERIALFEVGPVFDPLPGELLPDEAPRLALALSGPRSPDHWTHGDQEMMDFYDLKARLDDLIEGLHLSALRYEAAEDPRLHPGKSAVVWLGDRRVGVLGELHPLVKERYEHLENPLLVAELDLRPILEAVPDRYPVDAPAAFPPVLEDLAVVVDESVKAEQVQAVIEAAGGSLLRKVRLFDLYRGDQLGAGKKSLAYALVYQAADRTLTDQEVAGLREKIVQNLETHLEAHLRR